MILRGTALVLLASFLLQPASSDAAHSESTASLVQGSAAESQELATRLSTVAHRILVSNAQFCGQDSVEVLGMDISGGDPHGIYGWTDSDEDEFPTVVSVTPGAPAAESGIRVGDRITEINGEQPSPGISAFQLFSHWLSDRQGGPVALSIDRDGVDKRISVHPELACSYGVVLSDQDDVNALSQGHRAFVTAGMVRWLAKDDDLAVVVGHEIGHIAAGHTTNRPYGSMHGDVEPEADYLGVYFAARAGYDVSGAAEVLQRLVNLKQGEYGRRGHGVDIAERLQAIDAAVSEIRRAHAAGNDPLPSAERLSSHDWLMDSSSN